VLLGVSGKPRKFEGVSILENVLGVWGIAGSDWATSLGGLRTTRSKSAALNWRSRSRFGPPFPDLPCAGRIRRSFGSFALPKDDEIVRPRQLSRQWCDNCVAAAMFHKTALHSKKVERVKPGAHRRCVWAMYWVQLWDHRLRPFVGSISCG